MPPGFVGVVRTAAQFDVGRRRCPAVRERHDVMEFQEAALGATPFVANKGTACPIPSPDLTSDGRWDVAGARRLSLVRARSHSRGQLLPLQFCKQQLQGTLEHGGW